MVRAAPKRPIVKRGRPPLTARAAADRRDEILAAATERFASGGYERTDLQDVADAMGVGKGTIYRYFPSKAEVFLAAADRAMRLLREHVERASGLEGGVEGEPDALRRLGMAVAAYLDFFVDHPEFVELLIQERAVFRDRTRPTYFEHRDRARSRWYAMYRGLIADGRVRPMPVERIADALSSMIYGTMFTNFFTGRAGSGERQARELLDVFFNGIVASPASGSAGMRVPRKSVVAKGGRA